MTVERFETIDFLITALELRLNGTLTSIRKIYQGENSFFYAKCSGKELAIRISSSNKWGIKDYSFERDLIKRVSKEFSTISYFNDISPFKEVYNGKGIIVSLFNYIEFPDKGKWVPKSTYKLIEFLTTLHKYKITDFKNIRKSSIELFYENDLSSKSFQGSLGLIFNKQEIFAIYKKLGSADLHDNCIIHGDLKSDNFRNTSRGFFVFDFDDSGIGRPEFDLGVLYYEYNKKVEQQFQFNEMLDLYNLNASTSILKMEEVKYGALVYSLYVFRWVLKYLTIHEREYSYFQWLKNFVLHLTA